MAMNLIPVTIKHKDGSRTYKQVLARNILHKTREVVRNPEKLRNDLINQGILKPRV